MTAKFVPFQSTVDHHWYWHIQDTGNHKILGVGGEAFTTKQHVEDSIANLEADIRDLALDQFVVIRKEHWAAGKGRLMSAMLNDTLSVTQKEEAVKDFFLLMEAAQL